MTISLIAGCLFCWSQTKKMKRKVSLMGMKMMYDWGCFTDDQVRIFVPLCITDEEADKIINKDKSAS